MKRDMDFVRILMQSIEESESSIDLEELIFDGVSQEVIEYHLKLLLEAGLINGFDASSRGGYDLVSITLSWDGHEFLDTAKNDTLWNKAKQKATDSGISLAFSLLSEYLKQLAREKIGIL